MNQFKKYIISSSSTAPCGRVYPGKNCRLTCFLRQAVMWAENYRHMVLVYKASGWRAACDARLPPNGNFRKLAHIHKKKQLLYGSKGTNIQLMVSYNHWPVISRMHKSLWWIIFRVQRVVLDLYLSPDRISLWVRDHDTASVMIEMWRNYYYYYLPIFTNIQVNVRTFRALDVGDSCPN